jgi:hypothetical protein
MRMRVMPAGLKLVMWLFSGLGLLGLTMIIAFVVWIYFHADPVGQTFMSHSLNKQIAARNADWNQKFDNVDVTDLFQSNMKRGAFERELKAFGYSCHRARTEVDISQSFCQSDAGSNLVCLRTLNLRADVDAQESVQKVVANYWLTCW